ncbi:hypothetical protein GGS23DRAFT_552444 [Durotheca rogersii]|uniref:uncharacterized protein n=1 Tax=Durotheca rogersii TaxID=419775 RepID=UPI00221FB47E|nr:uncharacterized protein GGS23DRAFT_552444 [Durotheca rogersii]KAI5866858.1 hypothetical protein GGS23DRAFT_552444 [Durotheca rogersii]
MLVWPTFSFLARQVRCAFAGAVSLLSLWPRHIGDSDRAVYLCSGDQRLCWSQLGRMWERQATTTKCAQGYNEDRVGVDTALALSSLWYTDVTTELYT